jgi:hypothetical protein
VRSLTENWKRQKHEDGRGLDNRRRFRDETTIVTPGDPQYGRITGSHGMLDHQAAALIRTVESLQ